MARAIASPSAPPGRMVLPALALGSFITTLTFAASAPFLTDISRDLDVGVPLLGQITATMLILSAPLGLIAGPLADRYGPRRLILLGLAAAAACLLLFGTAPVFPVLVVAASVGAIAEATVPGLSLAMAGTRFPGPASRKAIGWIVAALASAPIVGVPILTTIGELSGWRAAFLVAGAVAVLIVVLVTAWLPPDAQHPDDALRVRTLLRAYQPLLHDGGMRRLFACSALRSLCWVGLLTYLGAFLRDRYDLTTSETGLVYMVGGTGYFLGSLVAGGPCARLPARPLVAIGNVVMAVLLLVAFSAWLTTLVTVGVLALAAAAAAIGWVGLTALMTTETPAGAGTTMVLNSALFSLGAAAGTAIGGVLLAAGGVDALAVGLPVVGVGSALCLWTPRPR